LLAHPDNIEELVDYLLFVDEPPLPGPIRGESGSPKNLPAPVRATTSAARCGNWIWIGG
jgi:hypothetical protein